MEVPRQGWHCHLRGTLLSSLLLVFQSFYTLLPSPLPSLFYSLISLKCYPYDMGDCHHPGCTEWNTPTCNTTCQNGDAFSKYRYLSSHLLSSHPSHLLSLPTSSHPSSLPLPLLPHSFLIGTTRRMLMRSPRR